MSDKMLWYGYLEAGNKSSPVVRDQRLETGNPETIYLFNLQKKEILEYKRAVVEPKLRELKAKEATIADELKSAFGEARRSFKPRGSQLSDIPEKGAAQPKKKEEAPLEEMAEFNDDEDIGEDDEDEMEEEE